MLITKRPVMVFDDSLSAVDSETDARIRAALRANVENTTVILIAHRITTLMHADQIIVMDKGRIAEQGTHEELIEKGGMYAKIYELQMQQSQIETEEAL
jgi:ATP-binding cassette subfamily B protein